MLKGAKTILNGIYDVAVHWRVGIWRDRTVARGEGLGDLREVGGGVVGNSVVAVEIGRRARLKVWRGTLQRWRLPRAQGSAAELPYRGLLAIAKMFRLRLYI